MLNIVHICLNGPYTDGWNYQENILSKYHKKSGNNVFLIASKWMWGTDGNLVSDDHSDFINDDGVHIIRLNIKGKENFNNKFKRFVGLDKKLEEISPDIIFVHGVAFCDVSVIVRYLKNHLNVQCYVDNHADFSNSATNWLSKNILYRFVWKPCARQWIPYVKKFYGVLPSRVDFLIKMFGLPKDKCELLVMGADDELVEEANKECIRSEFRKKYDIADDDFLVMTGGKIDAFKTQTLLLMEAVRNIENPRVKLIVFGSVTQELEDRVNSLADGEKVQYVGWINAKDSYKYFASADLVVFPGRHSVFWEQVVAQGIPMLCKKWEGTTHVDIGGNVEFLTEDSEIEIRNKIEDLVSDSEHYNRMKNVAVERGMKEFSYKNIAKRSIKQ